MFNLKCSYKIVEPPKHPTMCRIRDYKYLVVPEYAINYALDYCLKNDIKAVLNRDLEVIWKYNIEYDYVIVSEGELELL